MLVLNVNNSQKMPLWHFNSPYWRMRIQNAPMLVFASDGVGVGVVISLWSSENSVPIPLMTPSLTFRVWSSENQIVRVGSRSRSTKPNTKRGNVHSDWLILPLPLPTPTIWFSLDHKRNVSDGVVSGVGRNGNVLILLTPIPSRLWLRLRLRFLIFTRS